jgi:hypothetical protein
MTRTDVEIHPVDNDKIKSPGRLSTLPDFGNTARILSGENFIAGLYAITACASGYWILDRDCYIRTTPSSGASGETSASGCPPAGNMVFWFKADALSGIVTNGSTFETWIDSSGNARHATQPNASRRLTFVTNVYNFLPTVRTFGTLYGGYAASGFTLDAQHFTLYMVLAPSGSNFDGFAFSGGRFLQNEGAADKINVVPTNTGGSTHVFHTDVDTLAVDWSPAATGLKVLTLVYNGTAATGQFYINGSSLGFFDGGVDNTITTAAIGAFGPGSFGGVNVMPGDLCEYILYNVSHDRTTINNTYVCLGLKWGLVSEG